MPTRTGGAKSFFLAGAALGLALFMVAPARLSAEGGPARTDLEGARKAFLATLPAASGQAAAPARLSALADGLLPRDALALLAEFAPGLADPSASKALLEKAGRLAILLGEQEKAAGLLEAAAFRLPEARDDGLVLLSARCRLACGETDKASGKAELVLKATSDPMLAQEARLVSAWAFLLRGETKEALAASRLFLEGQSRGSGELEAFFIAWAASSGAEKAKAASALAKAFPESPEASIALSANPAIKQGRGWAELSPLPLYYLSGFFRSGQDQGQAKPQGQAEPPLAPTPPVQEKASPQGQAAAASPQGQAAMTVQRFQLGIFSDPGNAAELVAELAKKGFSARTEKRSIKGRELVAVIVEGDASTTLLKLKDAGYEAYPLFN